MPVDNNCDEHEHCDCLAPQIKSLIEDATLPTRAEVHPRFANLARTREPESKPRDQRLTGLTAMPGKPHQLISPHRPHALKLALDTTQCHTELLGDLQSPTTMNAQLRDLALTLRQTTQDRTGHALQLAVILLIDQLMLGSNGDAASGAKCRRSRVNGHLSPSPPLNASKLAMGRRAQPHEDLTLSLPTTPPQGARASLLKGVLYLLTARARMPSRNLRTQLATRLAASDPLDQRPRYLPASSIPTRISH